VSSYLQFYTVSTKMNQNVFALFLACEKSSFGNSQSCCFRNLRETQP